MTKPSEDLKQLYQEMYELTAPLCAQCPQPFACCSPEYCFLAKSWAIQVWDEYATEPSIPQKNIHTGVTIPFLGEHGCTAAPHHRPPCTAHVCEVVREKQSDEWHAKWNELHDKIQELEHIRIMGTFSAAKII